MRFGICCGIDKLPLVEKAGADYIELAVSTVAAMSDEEFEAAYEALKASPIDCESCNGMLPGEIKLVGEAYDDAQFRAYLEKAYGRCAKLGVKTVVFGSGNSRRIPDGYDREKAVAELVNAARIAGDYAAKYGITLAMEPLNTKECNVLTSSTDGFEFVKRVNHPAVKLLVDLYHFAYEKEPWEAIAQEKDVLWHTHIADMPGRKWPVKRDELVVRFLKELKAAGYDSRASLEGGCGDFETDAIAAIKALREMEAEL